MKWYIVAAVFFSLFACDSRQPEGQSSKQAHPTQTTPAPFEYELQKRDESRHTFGPQTVLIIEVKKEVAKKASEQDVKQFWKHISPGINTDRAFVKIFPDIPGASAWVVISRLMNDYGGWEVTYNTAEWVLDLEPFYFLNEEDAKTKYEGQRFVSLEYVNTLHEKLVRMGWTIDHRSETLFIAELRNGLSAQRITAGPESLEVSIDNLDFTYLFDCIDLTYAEYGIHESIKMELKSFIGSPEQLNVGPGKISSHYFEVGNYEISYMSSTMSQTVRVTNTEH